MNVRSQEHFQVASFGHDAPISAREADIYDRWPTATAISRVIEASSTEWSTRIGIFGK